jgi:2-polyprenyl-3-methyl-5-hydroxy-6-metoxy-1,4-benzoquinol methylase
VEYIVENEYGHFKIIQDEKYGFWRVSPSPTEEFLRSFYEQQYRNPSYSFHDQLYVDLICRRTPEIFRRKGRVLEIGCGAGDKLTAFKSEGFEAYGFEPGAIDYNACKTKGLTVFNHPFDIEIAAHYGPYSIIILAHILEHLPEPEQFLVDLHSLVGPEGILIIEVPNEFNAFQEMFLDNTQERRWFLAPPDHLNYFTPDSLAKLLQDKGWRVRHRTTRFPMELFLLMGRNYVDRPDVGKKAHLERVAFERSFMGGNEDTLWKFYDALAQVELGREIIVICEKAEPAAETTKG